MAKRWASPIKGQINRAFREHEPFSLAEPHTCVENMAISPDPWEGKEEDLPQLPISRQDFIELLMIKSLISKQ